MTPLDVGSGIASPALVTYKRQEGASETQVRLVLAQGHASQMQCYACNQQTPQSAVLSHGRRGARLLLQVQLPDAFGSTASFVSAACKCDHDEHVYKGRD